jgi:hypothetical protein
MNDEVDQSDFEDHVATPDVNQLQSLEKLVQRAMVLAKQVDDMMEIVSNWGKEYFNITEQLIPELMGAAGINQFTTKAGLKITIREFIEGSLPKKDEVKRKAAMEWLMNNGGADIIKAQIVIPFNRGDHNYKQEVKHALQEVSAEYKETEDVHHSTLAAFVREKIQKGEAVPIELLGLYAGRKARIEGMGIKMKKFRDRGEDD